MFGHQRGLARRVGKHFEHQRQKCLVEPYAVASTCEDPHRQLRLDAPKVQDRSSSRLQWNRMYTEWTASEDRAGTLYSEMVAEGMWRIHTRHVVGLG